MGLVSSVNKIHMSEMIINEWTERTQKNQRKVRSPVMVGELLPWGLGGWEHQLKNEAPVNMCSVHSRRLALQWEFTAHQ